jgi:hypothetical protein
MLKPHFFAFAIVHWLLVAFLPGLSQFAIGQEQATQGSAFDAISIAKQILDEASHEDLKSKLADDSVPYAAAVISALTQDLPANDRDETYRRIPWIWRIAIKAAKQNQPAQLRELLLLCLPSEEQSLTDWQAVVLGGGLINGLSQLGRTPADEIAKLLDSPNNPQDTRGRWERTIKLAAEMANNSQVPSGTRYDALRVLGAADWRQFGDVLKRYLEPGTDDELQMGAANALADLTEPAATKTLVRALPGLTEDNRNLAISILAARSPQKKFLRDAVIANEVPRIWLTSEQLKQLED